MMNEKFKSREKNLFQVKNLVQRLFDSLFCEKIDRFNIQN